MLWSQSVDSDDEDVAGERRGSAANSSASPSRRGSRLLDFLEKKKKTDRKRYKDKQGFVWRRMVPEETEDLPSPRAPHLGQWPDSPWLNPSEAGSVPTASIISTPLPQLPPQPPSLASTSSPPTTDQTLRKISQLRKLSNSSEPPLCTRPPPVQHMDSDSLTSFKTCPSDSNLQSLIVPRIVTDYKSPIPLPVAVNATSVHGTRIPSPHSPPQTPMKSTPIPQPAPSSYPQTGATPAPVMTTPVA